MSSSLRSLLVRLAFSNFRQGKCTLSREGSGLGLLVETGVQKSVSSNSMEPGVRQGGQDNFVVTLIN